METVKNIQEVAELKQRVIALETKVLKPELTNLKVIPLLYEWYKVIAVGIDDFPLKDTTEYRQIFMYCILMHYCPRTLVDGCMIRGLRQSIAELFNLSPSHISNLAANISFYYDNYSKFKNDCDAVLAELMLKIELNELS